MTPILQMRKLSLRKFNISAQRGSVEVNSSPESVWLQGPYSFIHSFVQQMFMKYPLFVRDYSQTLEYSQEQNKDCCLCEAEILVMSYR